MIELAWPWMLIVLPLPWLLRRIAPPAEPIRGAALRVPFLSELESRGAGRQRTGQRRWPLYAGSIAWVLLVLASARPEWLGDPISLPVSGRDLMMAVDLSGSMQERDFRVDGQIVDRLTATKWVAGKFIDRRDGDRIGLILFGERAYLQTPLTFDRQTVKTLLYESAIGLAGRATAIGDAIGLAVKRLRDRKESSRVLILLTDGANTAGAINPVRAAKLAAHEKLKIYTIGIGAEEMIVRSLFGSRKVNPSADLDERTLKAIADMTGGRYFRARDTEGLEEIYRILDRIEPIEQESMSFRPIKALYFWPLTAAVLVAVFLFTALQRRGTA